MKNKPKIAIVLLNYNSDEDLSTCIEQLDQQKNIDFVTIVVDNASSKDCVEKVHVISSRYKNVYTGTVYDINTSIRNKEINEDLTEKYFIYNDINNGYSAGNNIGIRLSDYLDVDAVLIANPDMRFYDDEYIYKLSSVLLSDQTYFIAGSKIVGLDGKDQNPLHEASFFEEVFWMRQYFKHIFKIKPYVMPYKSDKTVSVSKLMGCCLLLQMNFLREINYLDEGTFLYAEESILSAQVKNNKGKIIFIPTIEAVHAHKASEKGNSSERMLLLIKSRKYYLQKYSDYNQIQLLLLNFSYTVLAFLHKIKSLL